MPSHSFAVVIPVGPGDKELERVADLLDSLFHYEPHVAHVVLVDDVLPTRNLHQHFRTPPGCQLTALSNPRQGKGDGWLGGLAVGIVDAFRWVAVNATVTFAIKIDSDALVIAPFAEKIAAAFREHANIAQYGVFYKTPQRQLNTHEDVMLPSLLKKIQRPLTIWRRTFYPWPRLQCILFSRDRARRNLFRTAIQKGFTGKYCMGGSYALRGEILQAMLESGHLDDPLLWVWTPCGEDNAMSILTYACGGRADDLNMDGEPFAVIHKGLLDTPERLVERGFSIIHSVKDFQSYLETETRAFFKQRRQG